MSGKGLGLAVLEEPTGALGELLKKAVVNPAVTKAMLADLDKGIDEHLRGLLDKAVVNTAVTKAMLAGLDEGDDEGEGEGEGSASSTPIVTVAAPQQAAASKTAAPQPLAAAQPAAASKTAAPKTAAPSATAVAAAPRAAPQPQTAATVAEAVPTATAAPRESLAAAPKATPTEAAPKAAPMPGGGAVRAEEEGDAKQKPEDVEAIVAAFVAKNTGTWAAERKTFLRDDESVTTGKALPEELKNTLIHMDGFQLKDTGGTNNNCIVNALLTSLSPTFRRLEMPYKDKVSSYFRYEELIPIYYIYYKTLADASAKANAALAAAGKTDAAATKRAKDAADSKATAADIYREIYSGMEDYKADKAKTGRSYGGRFISVEVAGVFGKHFGINVLIKDRDQRWLEERLEAERLEEERKASKGGKVATKVATKVETKVETKTATNDDTVVKERGSFTFLGPNPPVDKLIIIHNIDGAHYSSIAGPGDQYEFPIDLVQNWLAASEFQDKHGIQSACPFVEDQVLRANHGIFIVLDSENNEKKPGCKHIYVYPLTSPIEVEEIKQLKKDLRNILSIEKVANGNEDKHGHLKLRANTAFEELKGTRYPRKVKTYTSPTDMFTDLKYWLEHAFINIIKDPEYRRNYTLAKPDPEDMTGYKTKYEYYLQNGGRDELLAIARNSVGLATAAPSPAAAGGGTSAATPAATARTTATAATAAPRGGTTAPTASSAKLAAAAREAAAKEAAAKEAAAAKAAATPAPTSRKEPKAPKEPKGPNPSVAERLAAAMDAQKLAATRTGTQKKPKEGKRKTRRK